MHQRTINELQIHSYFRVNLLQGLHWRLLLLRKQKHFFGFGNCLLNVTRFIIVLLEEKTVQANTIIKLIINNHSKGFIYLQVMSLPIIPVVLGSADYSKFAPTNSYVDVTKFDSAKDLSNFLLFLSSDGQAYNSYFEWKESYR